MKKLLLGIVFLGCFAGNLLADSIGHVDMQRVFLGYAQTQDAQKEFQKREEALKKDFEKRQSKIDKAKEKGKSDEYLKELVAKMEEELAPKQQALLEWNSAQTEVIKQNILSAINEVSTKYGVDVVLDKAVVLQGGFDLTQYVLEVLNAKK